MEFNYLPAKYHDQHQICWFLVSQIEEFLTNEKYSELRIQTVKLSDNDINPNEHVFDYLLRKGLKDQHHHIIKNNLVNGLLTDMCYFLQEALMCSLKRRLTVTFALIRKPFVYSLVVILRLMFEDGFIDKFNNEVGFDPANVKEEDKRTLIKLSLRLTIDKSCEVDDIYDWIFNKQFDSLANLSDKALHLTTTRNKHNLTGLQNFNFIFSNPGAIDEQWTYLYTRLQPLLFYLVQVIDTLIMSSIKVDDNFYGDRITERAKFLNKYFK